jgi:single-strand DNA-binding protein
MKNITIAGNLGRDAELRRTQDQTPVANFSVAVNDGWGDNKRALWFDCSVWGKRAETLSGMLTKGTKVAVTGDLSTREYNGNTYLTVRVAEVTLMGGREQREQREQRPASGGQQGGGFGGERGDIDDEIPF